MRAGRPTPCPACGHEKRWWNGTRLVRVVELDESNSTCVVEVLRDRAKCADCLVSDTVYEGGHYPRRQFQLDVVASVAAQVSGGTQSVTAAACLANASSTSVRRWMAWISQLTVPAHILAIAQKLQPDLPAPTGISQVGATICLQVVFALEFLGAALLNLDIELESYSGLGRVLEWQHRGHNVVVTLSEHLSPAMELGLRGASG